MKVLKFHMSLGLCANSELINLTPCGSAGALHGRHSPSQTQHLQVSEKQVNIASMYMCSQSISLVISTVEPAVHMYVPTPYVFVTDAQIAQVQPFSSPQEVLYRHQEFKCSQCQVQKATTCVGQASSLRLFHQVEFKCRGPLLCSGWPKVCDWPREKGYAGRQIFDSCRPRVFQV